MYDAVRGPGAGPSVGPGPTPPGCLPHGARAARREPVRQTIAECPALSGPVGPLPGLRRGAGPGPGPPGLRLPAARAPVASSLAPWLGLSAPGRARCSAPPSPPPGPRCGGGTPRPVPGGPAPGLYPGLGWGRGLRAAAGSLRGCSPLGCSVPALSPSLPGGGPPQGGPRPAGRGCGPFGALASRLPSGGGWGRQGPPLDSAAAPGR